MEPAPPTEQALLGAAVHAASSGHVPDTSPEGRAFLVPAFLLELFARGSDSLSSEPLEIASGHEVLAWGAVGVSLAALPRVVPASELWDSWFPWRGSGKAGPKGDPQQYDENNMTTPVRIRMSSLRL